MKKKLFAFATAIIVIATFQPNQGDAKTKKAKPVVFPETIVDSIRYTTDVPNIVMTMRRGHDTDVSFNVSPKAPVNHPYGFSVYGYGQNMPTYGVISNPASGGASGSQYLTLHLQSKYFPKKVTVGCSTYSGWLPIHIFHGSETGRDTNFIKLPITVMIKEQ